MPRWRTPDVTSGPDYVHGHEGTPYYAPSLDAVDRRICELVGRIREKGGEFPALADTWRGDIDRLLERRAFLQLMRDE